MKGLWLTDEEVKSLTKRRYPANQIKVLDMLDIPYRKRPDGTPVVFIADLAAAKISQEHQNGPDLAAV